MLMLEERLVFKFLILTFFSILCLTNSSCVSLSKNQMGRSVAQEDLDFLGYADGQLLWPKFFVEIIPNSPDEQMPLALATQNSDVDLRITIVCSDRLENNHWASFEDCADTENATSAMAFKLSTERTVKAAFPEIKLKFGRRRYKIILSISGVIYLNKDTRFLKEQNWTFIGEKAADFTSIDLANKLGRIRIVHTESARINLKLRTQEKAADWAQKFKDMKPGYAAEIRMNESSPFAFIQDVSAGDLQDELSFDSLYFLVPESEMKAYESARLKVQVDLSTNYMPMMFKTSKKYLKPALLKTFKIQLNSENQFNATINNCSSNPSYTRCSVNALCAAVPINSLVFSGLSKSDPQIQEGQDYCDSDLSPNQIPNSVKTLIDQIRSANQKLAGLISADPRNLMISGPNIWMLGGNYGFITSALSSNGNMVIGVQANWQATDPIESIYLHELGHFFQFFPEQVLPLNLNLKKLIQNDFFRETFGDAMAVDITGGALGYRKDLRYDPRPLDEGLNYAMPRDFFANGAAVRSLNEYCGTPPIEIPMKTLCGALKGEKQFVDIINGLKVADPMPLAENNFFDPQKPSIDNHQIGLPFLKLLKNLSQKENMPIVQILNEANAGEGVDIERPLTCRVYKKSKVIFSGSEKMSSMNLFKKNFFGYLNTRFSLDTKQSVEREWASREIDTGFTYGEQVELRKTSERFCETNSKVLNEKFKCGYNFFTGCTCETLCE